MENEIDFCDDGHQAIAFTGGCPICRKSENDMTPKLPVPKVRGTFYVAELKRALARYFANSIEVVRPARGRGPQATDAVGTNGCKATSSREI